jgi:hypothetical protein
MSGTIERSQSHKNKSLMSSFMWNLKGEKRHESKTGTTRDVKRGRGIRKTMHGNVIMKPLTMYN